MNNNKYDKKCSLIFSFSTEKLSKNIKNSVFIRRPSTVGRNGTVAVVLHRTTRELLYCSRAAASAAPGPYYYAHCRVPGRCAWVRRGWGGGQNAKRCTFRRRHKPISQIIPGYRRFAIFITYTPSVYHLTLRGGRAQ